MVGSSRYIKRGYVGISRKGMIDEIERVKSENRKLQKRICNMRVQYRRLTNAVRAALKP
jgi:hypothetical protein